MLEDFFAGKRVSRLSYLPDDSHNHLVIVEQHGEIFESMSVDDDEKSGMEMTGTSTFLGDFLADQMLRDPNASMQSVTVSTTPTAAKLIQA